MGAANWLGRKSASNSGALVLTPFQNNKIVTKIQNNTGYDLTVSYLGGIWDSWSNTAKLKGLIYSDASGVPGSLLAVSNERVGVDNLRTVIFTFSSPVVLANGSDYWIGVIGDSFVSTRCISSGIIYYNANDYASGPTETFGTGTSEVYTPPLWVTGIDASLRLGRASVDTDDHVGVYYTDDKHADKFTLAESLVDVQSISTYVTQTAPATKAKCAIYADSGGVPGALLGQTVEVTGFTANSWAEFAFASPVRLAAGTYWLATIFSADMGTPVRNWGASGVQYPADWIDDPGFVRTTYGGSKPDTEATAFADPCGTLSNNVPPFGIDIFATYTLVSAGGGARPFVACIT